MAANLCDDDPSRYQGVRRGIEAVTFDVAGVLALTPGQAVKAGDSFVARGRSSTSRSGSGRSRTQLDLRDVGVLTRRSHQGQDPDGKHSRDGWSSSRVRP